MLENRKPAVIG